MLAVGGMGAAWARDFRQRPADKRPVDLIVEKGIDAAKGIEVVGDVVELDLRVPLEKDAVDGVGRDNLAKVADVDLAGRGDPCGDQVLPAPGQDLIGNLIGPVSQILLPCPGRVRVARLARSFMPCGADTRTRCRSNPRRSYIAPAAGTRFHRPLTSSERGLAAIVPCFFIPLRQESRSEIRIASEKQAHGSPCQHREIPFIHVVVVRRKNMDARVCPHPARPVAPADHRRTRSRE